MFFKCKMCGGDIEIISGTNTGKCLFCQSIMTLPNSDNEKIINLFNRANDLRRQNEFDKAYGIYETILEIDNEQIEAHWGLLLCKYGVEYVDDPKTNKKIPTCHRTITTSIIEDDEFKIILKKAYGDSLNLYKEEAKIINDIQKSILEISQKEDPYDIFICYKETSDDGERTKDSVIAQDIYDKLIEKGYKVFFARITLEKKIGTEYEPYIYSALTSAKVMLVVGTEEKYFNAIWVKNEWSRYLELMKKDKDKNLIPVYSGIDPYKLPVEFAMLQAQSMDKIGAMQDLIHGIEKIVKNDTKYDDNDASELYKKFKEIEEQNERKRIEEAEKERKQREITELYPSTKKPFVAVTLGISVIEAILSFSFFGKCYVSAIGKRAYHLGNLFQFKEILVYLILIICINIAIAFFLGFVNKKTNRYSKYLYFINLIYSLIIVMSIYKYGNYVTWNFTLFVIINFALLAYPAKFGLSGRTIYADSLEHKKVINDRNIELKKEYEKPEKLYTKTNIILLIIGVVSIISIFVLNSIGKSIVQTNQRDKTKDQILVVTDKIPIKNAVGGYDVYGYIYKNEVYTIVNRYEISNDSFVDVWYKIELPNQTQGYVNASYLGYNSVTNEVVIKAEYVNIRLTPSTEKNDNIIKKAYNGEKYKLLEPTNLELNNCTYWYEIKTETGLTGFVYSGSDNDNFKILNKGYEY